MVGEAETKNNNNEINTHLDNINPPHLEEEDNEDDLEEESMTCLNQDAGRRGTC